MADQSDSISGQSDQLHCEECEASIQGLAQFCPFCGAVLPAGETVEPASAPSVGDEPPEPGPVTSATEDSSTDEEPAATEDLEVAADDAEDGSTSQADSEVDAGHETEPVSERGASSRQGEEMPADPAPVAGEASAGSVTEEAPGKGGKGNLGKKLLAVGGLAWVGLLVVVLSFTDGDEDASERSAIGSEQTEEAPTSTPVERDRRSEAEAEARSPSDDASPSRSSSPEPVQPPEVHMANTRETKRFVRPDLTGSVRVRDHPSVEHGDVVTSLSPGTELKATGQVADADWFRVNLDRFGTAYIHADLTTDEAPQTWPERISGPVERLVDTATLIVDGEEVRLHGVEPGVEAPYSDQMRAFIRQQGNRVSCSHEGEGTYTCQSAAGDLGELVILNGAAEASSDAPGQYFENESLARSAARGIWSD